MLAGIDFNFERTSLGSRVAVRDDPSHARSRVPLTASQVLMVNMKNGIVKTKKQHLCGGCCQQAPGRFVVSTLHGTCNRCCRGGTCGLFDYDARGFNVPAAD